MKPGDRVVFETSQTDLAHRSGAEAVIERAITSQEADLDETGPMWRIRFDDEDSIDAFQDELKEVE